jgi:hypothetical protein
MTMKPRGMDRTRYPADPVKVRQALIDAGAWYIDEDSGGKGRTDCGGVMLRDLISALSISPAQVGLFRQQLQDMQRHRFKEFGVHYGLYPTGWQVRVKQVPVTETERKSA